MVRLFRRKSPHLQPSLVLRLWLRLRPETRRQVRGIYLASSVNLILISILYAIGLAAPPSFEPLELFADFSSATETQEVFTLAAAEVEAPVDDLETELLEMEVQNEEFALDDIEPPPLHSMEVDTNADAQVSVGDESGFENLTGQDRAAINEINRRVKAAGGELNGAIRVSLMFPGNDDLDLHVRYGGHGGGYQWNYILYEAGIATKGKSPLPSYRSRHWINYETPSNGQAFLDVDANASLPIMESPCENVIFSRELPAGTPFLIGVHFFRQRSITRNVPYVVLVQYKRIKQVFRGTVRHGGPMEIVHQFTYPAG